MAEELKIKGLTQTNTAPSPAKSRVRDPPPTPPPPPKRGRPPKNQQQHLQLPPPVTIATAAAQSLVNKSFDNHDDELAPPIVPNVKTEQPPPPISAVEQYTAPTEPIIEYGGGGGGEEFGGDYEMGNYEAGYEDSMMDGGTVSADGNKGRHLMIIIIFYMGLPSYLGKEVGIPTFHGPDFKTMNITLNLKCFFRAAVL